MGSCHFFHPSESGATGTYEIVSTFPRLSILREYCLGEDVPCQSGDFGDFSFNDLAFEIPTGRIFVIGAAVNMIRMIDDLYIWRSKPQW